MAKELVTRLWCDNAAVHGDELVEGRTCRGALDGGPEVELELCDGCRAAVWDPLVELLGRVGQPMRGPRAKAEGSAAVAKAGGKRKSNECGFCDAAFTTSGALRSHLREQHGRLIDGSLVSESEHRCPLCDDGFLDPRGVSVHLRMTHGVNTREEREQAMERGMQEQEMLPA